MVNLKSSVFLFIGDETYLKDKAVKELRASLLNSSSQELDYKIFYGNETNARDILDYVTTLPFLASTRLVLIKDFERLPREDRIKIISYIKRPSKNARLVLECKDDSVLKDDTAIAKYADLRRFDHPCDAEMPSCIKTLLASRGKKMAEEAMDILNELQGQNLQLLDQEIDKLSTYVGDRLEIDVDDIEEVIGRSITRSAFDLAWAVSDGDIDRSTRLIDDLILGGKKTYEIVGLLAWHFKRILRAKILHAKGVSEYSIADALKIGRKYSKDFFKQVRTLNISEVKYHLKTLLEADLDIKNSKFDPQLILEIAVIKLCLARR